MTEQRAGTINTATFTDANGRAILTLLTQATSKTARDAIIDSGMESGLQDAMNLLEEVSVSIA